MYKQIDQLSPEWWALKVKKVSGTRWGEMTSGRDNSLIEELADEAMNKCCEMDDYVSDDMQFGIDNEPISIDKYEKRSGIKFKRGGVIISDLYPEIHMASPDGYNDDNPEYIIIAETKCTQKGKIHLRRFRKGIDTKYLPQVINYFAVEPKVQEVHWFSYCPFRPERELVPIVFKRDTVVESKETKKDGITVKTIQDKVNEGLAILPLLEAEVNELINNFKQLEF